MMWPNQRRKLKRQGIYEQVLKEQRMKRDEDNAASNLADTNIKGDPEGTITGLIVQAMVTQVGAFVFGFNNAYFDAEADTVGTDPRDWLICTGLPAWPCEPGVYVWEGKMIPAFPPDPEGEPTFVGRWTRASVTMQFLTPPTVHRQPDRATQGSIYE